MITDDQVLLACGWTHDDNGWTNPDNQRMPDFICPNPVTSVDDALMLVPEGWKWDLSENEACLSRTGDGFLSGKGDQEIYGHDETPALALCQAILRSMENDR